MSDITQQLVEERLKDLLFQVGQNQKNKRPHLICGQILIARYYMEILKQTL